MGTISSTGKPANQLCPVSHQETSAVMERKMFGPRRSRMSASKWL
jgi:hypothetical protein